MLHADENVGVEMEDCLIKMVNLLILLYEQ